MSETSEELIRNIQNMLNEEKWTRATISDYSKNIFIEFAQIAESAKAENCVDEIKALCDEHLQHTQNSIIALYLSGIFMLKKRMLDNSALETLIGIFQDNHKTNLVVFLCETILDEDDSNRFAIRVLADHYRAENNDKVWGLYERLVNLDHDEADIARRLAEYYEKQSDLEKTVSYYKKAILRYIDLKQLAQAKEVWSKLISFIPEEIDFFYLIQRKIAKNINKDKSALMMQELYGYYRENERWDTAIDILKTMLSIDEKNVWARKELVNCFCGKYAEHSQLELCIRESNLNQNWRNVFEAISDFEKHIAFDVKNFVFHRSWGIGIIRSVLGDQLSINFGKKNSVREMSLKMATTALRPLSHEHIQVLKATKSKEELAKQIKEDKTWALKMLIKSFGNNCDFKQIKTELVPSILTPSEWTSWSVASRKILNSNSLFGVNPDNISQYKVRDHEVPPEEKLASEFKAQKKFFDRIDTLMRFVADVGTESELFAEMYDYFAGYLKTSSVSEQIIASFLVIRRLASEHPHLGADTQRTFAELFEEIKEPNRYGEIYLSLKDTKITFLRKDFLQCVHTLLPNWVDVYIKLFPIALRREMITILLDDGHADKVKELAQKCFDNFREYREAAIFFFRECQEEDWFKEAGVPYEKQLITMIHLIDLTCREMANHFNTMENRKINRQIQTLLFKKKALLTYMLGNDENTITRLYTLVDDLKELDSAIKMKMRNSILTKYPEFKFHGTEEKKMTPQGLLVTLKMYEAKKQQLDHITAVEIPANSKEIGEAMAQGDLRENAEYKAAKEKQVLLALSASRLQEEINRAHIFDPTTIITVRVSFGTCVTLKNEKTGETESYTILGPWESDPENHIISYMSPFGNAILNSKTGEKRDFIINEQDRSYTIQKIEAAQF